MRCWSLLFSFIHWSGSSSNINALVVSSFLWVKDLEMVSWLEWYHTSYLAVPTIIHTFLDPGWSDCCKTQIWVVKSPYKEKCICEVMSQFLRLWDSYRYHSLQSQWSTLWKPCRTALCICRVCNYDCLPCRLAAASFSTQPIAQEKTSFGGLKDEDRIFTNLYCQGDPFMKVSCPLL